ncbi:MAG: GMC oxidoreductase [Sandaracinus sp.]
MTKLYLPLSRRTFVRLSAYGAAAAAFGTTGCNSSAGGPEQVENLIIGSGFGGAITAYRLAEAGHSSVILERGRRWTTPGDDVFSNMSVGMVDNRSSWLSRTQPLPGLPPGRLEPYTGVLERVMGDGIDVVCAAAVGGGSIVYSGMTVQPPQDLFDEVFGPTGVTFAEMDTTWYPKARQMMGTPTQMPDEIFNDPRWITTKTFLEQANHAGFTTGGTGRQLSDRLYCAFDWSRAPQDEQLINGSYIFGLNSGAKGSLDKFYLGYAERGVGPDMQMLPARTEVRDLHWVQRIVQRPDGFLVEVDVIDTDGTVLESRQIQARRLFVCAGTANTNSLLLRAKSEQTIEGLPDSVGEGFGNNGQHIVARKNVGVDLPERQAGPACAMIFDYDMKIGMENGPAPLGFANQILISTGQGVPDSRGTLTWDATRGKVVPHWTPAIDQSAADATQYLLTTLNAANGGEVATRDLGLDVSITFHPLGGCVMGETTDRFGRMNGVPNLYVIDGSLIPGCTPCSNPYWTISANAERCIDTILREDFT